MPIDAGTPQSPSGPNSSSAKARKATCWEDALYLGPLVVGSELADSQAPQNIHRSSWQVP